MDIITISGPDGNDLLQRRIIPYFAGSDQASKSEEADQMMLDIVRENLGEDAEDPDRDLTSAGFSLDRFGGSAPLVSKAFAYRKVIDVLQDIADMSAQAGTNLFFDVTPNLTSSGRVGFTFRTYPNIRGHDHSSNSIRPVFFGDVWENLSDPSLEYDWSEEANFVYVGGGGEGEARAIVTAEDASLLVSPWGRSEIFADARNLSVSLLDDKGRESLAQNRPYLRFTGTLVDSPAARFGRDWDFGDLVTAQFMNKEFTGMVRSVNVGRAKDREDFVDAKLEVIE